MVSFAYAVRVLLAYMDVGCPATVVEDSQCVPEGRARSGRCPAPSALPRTVIGCCVRDASGAVLPGVTVEAASPVLIEKVRTAVTDDTGQYRIENLPPGTYSLTFTLPGFVTVKREGVELSGSGVLTINSDMRVGGIQETITVTGESPVVDTQTSTRRQVVLTDEVIQEIPAFSAETCWPRCRAFKPLVSTSAPACRRTSSRRAAAWQRRHDPDRRDERGLGVQWRRRRGLRLSDRRVVRDPGDDPGGLGETDRGGPQFNLIRRPVETTSAARRSQHRASIAGRQPDRRACGAMV